MIIEVLLNYSYQIKVLVKRLIPLYMVYFICRILFYIFNKSMFANTGFVAFLSAGYHGLRFDTFSIMVANTLFILLSIIPIKQFYNRGYQKVLLYIYIITNSVFLLPNCVDIAYFPFIKKRSSADLFNQLGGQTDMSELLPQYFKDFWWVLVIFITLVLLVRLAFIRTAVNPAYARNPKTVKEWIWVSIPFLAIVGLTVLGIRGGTQRVPIDIIEAGANTPPEEVAIVLNTPFTLIKTLGKKGLTEESFYTSEELSKHFNPVHRFDSVAMKKKNVVIILLESFAREYSSIGKTGKSYTPFIDSLSKHCLVFSNTIANGNKSIEGIPAVLSSMPQHMENPYINSHYSGNAQTTFANLLAKEGYSSAFMHGGTNGTMNFDSYSKLAGYQFYFGRNEYGNDNDFDGFWGIWDEPFLQYSVRKMNDLKQPFHSAIFTLSSHHPYYVPKQHEGKFPKGTLENHASIGYTDYALKRFFESAKKTAWYNNTLFILCADHSSLSDNAFYKSIIGQQCIYTLFFEPGANLQGNVTNAFAQVDILPTALNLLGYNRSFFAFGQSYFKENSHNCYYYNNGYNLLATDSMIISFNKNEIASVFNYRRDSLLTKQLKGQFPELEKKLTDDFKGFIQTYNHALISNEMQVK